MSDVIRVMILPGHLLVVVVERQPLQVGERAHPQAEQHAARRSARSGSHPDGVDEADQLHARGTATQVAAQRCVEPVDDAVVDRRDGSAPVRRAW